MADTSTPAPAYDILGRIVSMPVEVRDASSGAASYLVSAAAARSMLPGDDFEVVELVPGRALLSLAAIDYRDNDLGDYHEVSVALMVRERGAPRGLPYLGAVLDLLRGRIATYICWLPVNQSFTCEAGRRIWGFPKTVEEIDLRYEGDRVTCELVADGARVLSLSLPRGGKRDMPESEMTTYTHIDGAPHRTRFVSRAEGFGFRLGGAELSLGNHPFANKLRELGLPRRALMSTWMEKMVSRFEAPEKL